MPKPNILTLIMAASLCVSIICHAQDMDVDQADSLDFERFHTDKKNAVKIWSDKNTTSPTKAYDTETASKEQSQSAPLKTKQEKTNTEVNNNAGKRFEIRELYSITGSTRTGYTPNTVVQALYLQMQGLCSKGWTKLEERSVPDEDEYYMYYVFKCL